VFAIVAEGAAGDHAVDMDVLIEPLPPSVQDHGDAELAAEPAWIAPEFQQRLRGGSKQQPVDHLLVVLGQGIEPIG